MSPETELSELSLPRCVLSRPTLALTGERLPSSLFLRAAVGLLSLPLLLCLRAAVGLRSLLSSACCCDDVWELRGGVSMVGLDAALFSLLVAVFWDLLVGEKLPSVLECEGATTVSVGLDAVILFGEEPPSLLNWSPLKVFILLGEELPSL